MHHGPYKRLIAHEVSEHSGLEPGGDATIQKGDVLQWLQQSEASDVAWVLNRLIETKPQLFFDTLGPKLRSCQLARANSKRLNRPAGRKWKKPSGGVAGLPIVQFSAPIFFAEEGVDNLMVVDVMRIGDQQGRAEVFWETEDDSAQSGRSYVASCGKLVFEPGVMISHIEIPIIDNDVWDTTTEFRCWLKQEGLKGAVLDQYLYKARVKIVDNNHFPTDRFTHLDTPRKIQQSAGWSLLFGYFILVANIPNVWLGTIKYAMVDILHNVWYLFSLFMNVYILDLVVDTSSPSSELVLTQDRHLSLLLCSLFAVSHIGWAHFLDYSRITFAVGGPARNFVQSALVRKFLNYKLTVREHLQEGTIMMGIEQDADDLVKYGYSNALKVFSAVIKLLFMLTFKLSTPFLFDAEFDWRVFLSFSAMPALLMIFVYLRQDTTAKALSERNEAHMELTSQISSTTAHWSLLVDYHLRNYCEHVFQDKQKKFGAANTKARQTVENNTYFCKWCANLGVALWLIYGGLKVIDSSLSVGLFVTNLTLFQALGGVYSEIYSLVIEMMQTFPAIVSVTALMNRPTDVPLLYQLAKEQRHAAKAELYRYSEICKKDCIDAVPLDLMPIVLNFPHPFKFEMKPIHLNFKGRLEVPQGQLVDVVGPLGSGKATLLRLISGSMLPGENCVSSIFVPPHLRVMNVAEECIFFAGSLYENMIFGMDRSHLDASRERVKFMCKHLTQNDTIADYLDEDYQEALLIKVLSASQCKLLSIARALVHNAEVLTMHKPLTGLTNRHAEHVMDFLHEHIENKGLMLTSDPEKRRPRTVFVSAARDEDQASMQAHSIIKIHPSTGMTLHACESIEGSSKSHRSGIVFL